VELSHRVVFRPGSSRGLELAISKALGTSIVRAEPLSGGDINDAHAVSLADGCTVFVKTNAHSPAGMFPGEARGLAWLAEARALRVPEVLAVGPEHGDGAPAFLVLELITAGNRGPDFDEHLGHGLAALHDHGAPGFGLDHDNFIGRLPQSNVARSSWMEFYRDCRLQPQLRRAVDARRASPAMINGFERLFDRLASLVGPDEPPARLHGDLWGGNLLVDDAGEPCLIDPAVYGGHREMDLAMMRLFGGFSPRVFDAYDEAHPLAPDHQERVPLYQLYPLLVHVNLFGGGYVGSVEAALRRLV
jgi:protein-ribulosamine 3-kinase